MVIPRNLREEVGVEEGTLMKVAVVEGGQFLIIPQLAINRSIVTSPRKSRKQVFQELSATVAELRQEAKEKGLDKMPMTEIHRAVAAARKNPKKTSNHPAK